MTRQIVRKAKVLQAKSRGCEVTFRGGYNYAVKSTSGNTYTVTFAKDQNVTACTCDWGKYRPEGTNCGCSHVLAVAEYVAEQEGQRAYAWATEEDAKRQHKHVEHLGDGLTLTVG